MQLSVKVTISACFYFFVMSCHSAKISRSNESELNYNQLLCFFLEKPLIKKSFSTKKCIKVETMLSISNGKTPFRVVQQNLSTTDGIFSTDKSIILRSTNCDSIQLLSYNLIIDDRYPDNTDSNCIADILQLSQPFFIDSQTIYVVYNLSCGFQCGTGYYAILDITDPYNYREITFDFHYVI